MSNKSYYKEIFNYECDNIERILFNNTKLLAEWKKIHNKDLFYGVALINSTVYCLYFDEIKGYLFVPENYSSNDDFSPIIRFNRCNNELNYTLYERNNDILHETKYNIKLLEDKILLDSYNKEYDIKDIGKVKNSLNYYDEVLLDDKPYNSYCFVRVIHSNNKTEYIKQSSNEIQDTYSDSIYTNYYLFDIANIIMNKDKSFNSGVVRTLNK